MSRPDMIDSLPQEYQSALREVLNLRIVSTAAFVVIWWDYLRDLTSEYYVWKDLRLLPPRKMSTALVAFLIQRYAVIAASTIGLTILWGGPNTPCFVLVATLFTLTAISMTCIAFVFASRTCAIYENARWIRILLFSCLPCIFGLYLVSAIGYDARSAPVTGEGCPCELTRNGRATATKAIGFGASLSFDVLVFSLTTYRLWKMGFPKGVTHTVINSSILYLSGAGGIHLTMVILVLKASTAVEAGTPIGLLLALTSSLCARMVFTLRDRLRRGGITPVNTMGERPESSGGRAAAFLPLLRPASRRGPEVEAEICVDETRPGLDHRGSSLTLLQEVIIAKPDCTQPTRSEVLR